MNGVLDALAGMLAIIGTALYLAVYGRDKTEETP